MPTGQYLLSVLQQDIDGLKSTILDAQQKNVSTETLNNVVELATLRAFSSLETFLQELFYLCMRNDPSVAGTGSIIPVSTQEEINLLVLTSGGKQRVKYLSWLPFDQTLDLADTYLNEGHPFSRLQYRKTETDELKELTVVRNAIAHPSDHARQEFEKLANKKSYPSGRASDYLLSTRSGAQEVLLLMTRAELVAKGLAAMTEGGANAVLEPEPPFMAQAKSPKGTYECIRCGHTITRTTRGELGGCPSCEPRHSCSQCGRRASPTSRWRRIIA
ncbi:hypothetical protein [Kocuria sp. WN036]|uniref:hypothetical protein n=1 Tax=Kocuria sp. WN036 TaxID=2032628 RepID=UPI00114110A5|nr:hypothetical protein [Kocuria sp. WN036]